MNMTLAVARRVRIYKRNASPLARELLVNANMFRTMTKVANSYGNEHMRETADWYGRRAAAIAWRIFHNCA